MRMWESLSVKENCNNVYNKPTVLRSVLHRSLQQWVLHALVLPLALVLVLVLAVVATTRKFVRTLEWV